MEFSHFDEDGNAVMVDVSGKEITQRRALAEGKIRVSREVFEAIAGRKVKKGDVLTVAQVAGIMGTKSCLLYTSLLTRRESMQDQLACWLSRPMNLHPRL